MGYCPRILGEIELARIARKSRHKETHSISHAEYRRMTSCHQRNGGPHRRLITSKLRSGCVALTIQSIFGLDRASRQLVHMASLPAAPAAENRFSFMS